MALFDANYSLISIQAGASGRRGDANVFHNSKFGKKLNMRKLNLPPPCPVVGAKGDLPFVFVGDNAFNRSENMVTPYKGAFQPPINRVLNYRVSRARNVSENGFGIMVARFGILQKAINGSEELADATILGTAVLHNWLLMIEQELPSGERTYCPKSFTDRYRADGSIVRGEWRGEIPELEDACLEYLTSAVEGAEPWGEERLDGDLVSLQFAEYFIQNDVPWQWDRTYLM